MFFESDSYDCQGSSCPRNRTPKAARPPRGRFRRLCCHVGRPIVVRYIGGKPLTAEETWAKVLRYAGLWSLLGFGYWALEEKATARFIGELGFADFRRNIQPSLDGVPELGWALVSRAHGKGYATEAVRAAIAWGDESLRRDESCASSRRRMWRRCTWRRNADFASIRGQRTRIAM